MFAGSLPSEKVIELLTLLHTIDDAIAAACWIQTTRLEPQVFTSVRGPEGDRLGQVFIDAPLKMMCERLFSLLEKIKVQSSAKADMLDSIDGLRAGRAALTRVTAGLEEFAEHARANIVAGLMSKVDELAKVCEERAPRWAHIASDDDYKPALAKRQLLKSPARNSLPDMANRLYTLVRDVEGGLKFMGMASLSEEVSDTLVNGSAVWEMCAATLAVIAACNILEEFATSPNGPSMASTFLASQRPRDFPKSLEGKLKSLAQQKR